MKIFVIAFYLLILAAPARADAKLDSDNDGLPDEAEINIYHTDPFKADTDGDGYNDSDEIKNSYSPLDHKPVKLEDSDYDHDSLPDSLEIKFHTNLTNPDTDGDGYKDGEEIVGGYDPSSPEAGVKLLKKIEVNTKQQKLSYYLSDVKLGEFPVSSGKNNSTPKGAFKALNKVSKAWSPYGLWMPYWVGLGTGKFGIHELPIWPNGYREGRNHLGHAVSHGCIRLGIGPAKFIYDWTEPGMTVLIN